MSRSAVCRCAASGGGRRCFLCPSNRIDAAFPQTDRRCDSISKLAVPWEAKWCGWPTGNHSIFLDLPTLVGQTLIVLPVASVSPRNQDKSHLPIFCLASLRMAKTPTSGEGGDPCDGRSAFASFCRINTPSTWPAAFCPFRGDVHLHHPSHGPSAV